MFNIKKIRLDSNVKITGEIIQLLINENKSELDRMNKLYDYYNTKTAIKNRKYKNPNAPQNRIAHGFANYISNMAVGFMLANPITYKSENLVMLETFDNIFSYNDDSDHNTTLAKYVSIFGVGYEFLYTDIDSQLRYKAVDPREIIVVYDNTIDDNILYVIRHYKTNSIIEGKFEEVTKIEVYDKFNISYYTEIEVDKKRKIIADRVEEHYFNDVPFSVYINNDECEGDFENVIDMIDAYDKTQSDTANDFEYFTQALLVISGILVDSQNGLDFQENKVINFDTGEGTAQYLIKNINDTALENYKDRLVSDIHKFSFVPELGDENFVSNLSGVAMQYKLMALLNMIGVKEAKFRKGLMRRIELICNFLAIKNKDYKFNDIEVVFTRNKPQNELELAQMVQMLTGIISHQTQISKLSFVDNVTKELERIKDEKKTEFDDYNDTFSKEVDVNGKE